MGRTELNDALIQLKINANNGSGQVDIDGGFSAGNQTSGNKTEIDSEGSLNLSGDATDYNDIQFSISTARVPAANAPTWTGFTGNLSKYTFGIGDYVDLEAQEVVHGALAEEDKEWHVHIFTNGIEVVDKVVNYQIEYAITQEDGTPSVIVISKDFTIPANTPDLTKLFISVGVVSGTGQTSGEDISVQLKRIAAVVGAAPVSDPFVSMVGLHIKQSRIGSANQIS